MLNRIKKFCDERTKIIITTPNAFGLLNFIRYSINKFKEGNEHVMSFNKYNIKNLFIRYGYDIVSIDTCYQPHAKSYGILFYIKNIF